MIVKRHIILNLRQLNRSFLDAESQKHGVYFAKLAILELCGWIEVSMDALIIEHCNRHLTQRRNLRFVENDVVKKTYGFDYESHFRKMLINIIGIIACEKLEAQVNVAVFTKFIAQLNSLKLARNGLAHTYLKGMTAIIDAPSVTMSRFDDIYAGLKEYEAILRLF